MRRVLTSLVPMTLLVLACALPGRVVSTPTEPPHPPTATQRSLPTPSPTARASATPAPSKTPLPLSQEAVEEVLQAYRLIVFIEMNAHVLNQAATWAASGELVGSEQSDALLLISGMMDAVGITLAWTGPPELLPEAWEAAAQLHFQTRDLAERWSNHEIEAPQVLVEMEPILRDIGRILDEMVPVLVDEYHIDAGQVVEARQEMLAGVEEILRATPTATTTN